MLLGGSLFDELYPSLGECIFSSIHPSVYPHLFQSQSHLVKVKGQGQGQRSGQGHGSTSKIKVNFMVHNSRYYGSKNAHMYCFTAACL